jgi:thioester reductase-like protein
MKQKTILITGATGFLGIYITRELFHAGFSLKLLIRETNGIPARERFLTELPFCILEEFFYNPPFDRIEIISGDILRYNLGLHIKSYTRLAETVDEVFHCAATTKFNDEPDALNQTNVLGTEHISMFCITKKPKRLHYISTAYVAGKRRDTVLETELDKGQLFNNAYEKSKFDAEKNLAEFTGRHHLPYTIYRPSIITGDSTTGYTKNYDNIYVFGKELIHLKNRTTQNIIKKTDAMPNGFVPPHAPLRVPGDRYGTINLIPVDYAAQTIKTISLRPESINNTFQVVNPSPPTVGELAEWIKVSTNINNLKIVPPEEFNMAPPTLQEELLVKKIRAFQPYMFGEPNFDSTNTRKILSGTGIACPLITPGLINHFMQYAIDTGWGRKKQTGEIRQREHIEILQ